MKMFDANQQVDLRQKIEDCANAMARSCMDRLQAYEQEHGAVTPAPFGTKFKARSSVAQQMAVTKRILITHGWLKEDGETLQNLTQPHLSTHDELMDALTEKVESLSRVTIRTRRVAGQVESVAIVPTKRRELNKT